MNNRCGTAMCERVQSDLTDESGLYCPKCKAQKSLQEGSFFAKSRMKLKQWLMLMYMWAREYPIKDAQEEARVSKKTAIDVYQWLREVCSSALLQTPIKLGARGCGSGQRVTVQPQTQGIVHTL